MIPIKAFFLDQSDLGDREFLLWRKPDQDYSEVYFTVIYWN